MNSTDPTFPSRSNLPTSHAVTAAPNDSADRIPFDSAYMVRGELTALWLYADKLPPDYDGSPGAFGYHPPVVFNAPFIPMPGEEAPRFWLLGMSMEFRKAIRGIDRKLQGRILEAIDDISAQPITPRGDTVKRLTGDFKNFWRYRIGDFRLVYLPDAERRHVTLKTFAARGGVYD